VARKTPVPKAAYVYVARDGAGIYKIGATCNPERRALDLGYGDSWVTRPVTIVAKWHRPNDARAVEQTALRLMEAEPVRGLEWFSVDSAIVLETVAMAIVLVDNGRRLKQQVSVRRWRRERMTVRAIAERVKDEFGVAVSHTTIANYTKTKR